MLLKILVQLRTTLELNEMVISPVLKKIMPRRPKETKVPQSLFSD